MDELKVKAKADGWKFKQQLIFVAYNCPAKTETAGCKEIKEFAAADVLFWRIDA